MKKIKSIIITALLVASVFILISPVSAATYHVYESDGWQVLHDTIQNAPSGSTIYVHAGTYYILDPIDITTYSNITVIGDSPHNTIIDATSSGGDGFYAAQNYVTIKNITVKNADYDGIDVEGYAIIENCIVYGSGDNGFEVGYDCTLKNCLAYDNADDGFHDSEDCTYINCTAANNGDNGFYSGDDGGDTLVNCIAIGNTEDGFDIENYSSEILYSNAWNNGDEDYESTDPGIGSISVDPKFVNGIDTFYLSPGSPCVDKGSTSSAALGLYQGFTTRTDGKWDTGTVDMGFHYKSNRGPPSSLPMAKILEILKGNQED